jgi:hypothetical protein
MKESYVEGVDPGVPARPDAAARLLGLEITVPHYSTFSRRAATLTVPKPARPADGPVRLAVDATGLKVYGEGERKVRVHGPDKRGVWRKPHLALDTRIGAARTPMPWT